MSSTASPTPVESTLGSWFETADAGIAIDELALKVALAQSLPGVDATAVVVRQRAAIAAELNALLEDTPATDLAAQLVHDARIAAAESVLGWLARSESLLAGSQAYPLDVEPARRGRPVRA